MRRNAELRALARDGYGSRVAANIREAALRTMLECMDRLKTPMNGQVLLDGQLVVGASSDVFQN